MLILEEELGWRDLEAPLQLGSPTAAFHVPGVDGRH